MPRTAATHALHEGLGALGDSRLMAGWRRPAMGTAATAAAARGSGGGFGADGGIPRGEGDPRLAAVYDEAVAAGDRPRPEGAQAASAGAETSSGALDAGADAEHRGQARRGSGAGVGTVRPAPGGGAGGRRRAVRRASSPTRRIGWGPELRRRGDASARTPTEDIWMWEGVPPGHGLITRDTSRGRGGTTWVTTKAPLSEKLPPAWPPGQGPDA